VKCKNNKIKGKNLKNKITNVGEVMGKGAGGLIWCK
jgi:hypothetical protein